MLAAGLGPAGGVANGVAGAMESVSALVWFLPGAVRSLARLAKCARLGSRVVGLPGVTSGARRLRVGGDVVGGRRRRRSAWPAGCRVKGSQTDVGRVACDGEEGTSLMRRRVVECARLRVRIVGIVNGADDEGVTLTTRDDREQTTAALEPASESPLYQNQTLAS